METLKLPFPKNYHEPIRDLWDILLYPIPNKPWVDGLNQPTWKLPRIAGPILVWRCPFLRISNQHEDAIKIIGEVK